ncbi:zinc finger protein 729-like isoform X1 [Palaemon carinicauda]|uniref:zinc finger protein 729-like isoform X1 n=1 Tax=Palaemon carinicauda TaxID=392227 RepID=UPI0035B5A616
MMASTSNTVFKCALCSQVCETKSDLNEHMSLHLGNKKYSCNLCGKKFFNEKSLELHISIHATEIKYEAMSSSSEEQMMLSDHVDSLINENPSNKIPQVRVRVKSFQANSAAVKEPDLKNLDNEQMHFHLTDEEFGVIEESEVYTTCGEVLEEKKPVQFKVWSKEQNYKPASDASSSKAPYVIRVLDKIQESQRTMQPDIFRENEGPSQLPIRILVGSNIRLENLDLHNFTSLTEEFKADGLSPVNIGHEQSYNYESYGEGTYQEESHQNQPLEGIKEELQSLQQVIEEGDLQSLQEELGAEELKSLEETMASESLQSTERVMDNTNEKLPEDDKCPLLPQNAIGKEAQIPITDPTGDHSSHMFTCKSPQSNQEEVNDEGVQSAQCEFEESSQPMQKPQQVGSSSLKDVGPLPLSEVQSGDRAEVWEAADKIQPSNVEECVVKGQQSSQKADSAVIQHIKDEVPIDVGTGFDAESSMLPVLVCEDEGNFGGANSEINPAVQKDKEVQLSKDSETLISENEENEFKRQIMQSSKRPHKCQVCGLGFRFAFYLKAHQAVHLGSNQRFMCDICGKGFKTMDAYERHQQLHDDPRSFECPECKKKLSSEFQLRKHLALHKQIKRFECYVCLEKFSSNRQLRSHLKRHTINKCYICDKVFKESSKLKRHLTTHLNKKLHDCASCKRTLYCHPVDFERHKKMHQNIISCPNCFQEFSFQNFERHKQLCIGNCDKNHRESRKDLDNTEDENKVRRKVAGLLIDELLRDISEEDLQGNPFLCDSEDWLEEASEGMTKEKLKDCLSDCTTKDDILRELSIYFESDIIRDAVSDCLLRERVAVQQLSSLLDANEKIISSRTVGRKRKRKELS